MIDFLGWFAMASGIIAAIMISVDAGRKITGWGFVVFTASSLSWIVVGIGEGEPPLSLQNVVLTVINVVGIYRWLIRKKKPASQDGLSITNAD
jgi:nicotinamide riboside transporter PnuC